MEFGKVDPKELNKIDLSLPPDPSANKDLFRKLEKKKHATKVFMGCAKWGRKDWVGKIYPKGTKEPDFLDHYAKHFDSIELNATFYQVWGKETIEKWAKKTGKDFRFCPKFYQAISHRRRLKGAKDVTDLFLQSVHAFGDKLGPCFLQMPDNFGPKNFDALETYLKDLPRDLEVFVEVRNEEWFQKENAEKLFGMLARLNKGAVITDAAGRRDCVHMHLTTPKTFVRFVGNALHKTDYTRIDDWVQRIKQWMKHGVQEVYFFMHQHEELHSPELARYTIIELNKHCKLDIPVPQFVSDKVKDLFGK
jgi:uncharacterized protein YecE (DUF72 family)